MAASSADPDAGKEFDAHGFNVVRIENEYKLSVPDAIVEDVWNYLEKRYDNDGLFLKKYDPSFSTKLSDEDFTDEYFDTDDFTLLNMESGIRHRTRHVTSDKNNRKNGRELVQIKLHRTDDRDTNRSEIKFPVKHYDTIKDAFDGHPLIGMINRDNRPEFLEWMKKLNIRPETLKNTLTLNQRRRRVYVLLNNNPFATITLDNVTSQKWGTPVAFTEIEVELNEIAYTESSGNVRDHMQTINDDMKHDLLKTFPKIKQDQTPKYNKTFNRFDHKFLLFPLALQNDMPLEWLIYGALTVILGAGVYFLITRMRAAKP